MNLRFFYTRVEKKWKNSTSWNWYTFFVQYGHWKFPTIIQWLVKTKTSHPFWYSGTIWKINSFQIFINLYHNFIWHWKILIIRWAKVVGLKIFILFNLKPSYHRIKLCIFQRNFHFWNKTFQMFLLESENYYFFSGKTCFCSRLWIKTNSGQAYPRGCVIFENGLAYT